ncbi:flagellar basal body P-ring protein FlgI [Roseiconus lacunae]|uniref:flagellar basal body P-ring protein FlgI n=1 Tax=Roseiconus lacunae TaxID=2605694 RepID=UPI001E5AE606|nr:flagellar basal body P-ring protein FlgI [Roseiconus lacunae]MCD0461713.1 flagellar basal body P-ring protein FlgI [Roseiconus lacunae]
MQPRTPSSPTRRFPIGFLIAGILAASLAGCSLLKGKKDGEEKSLASLMEPPTPPELIGQAAAPRGLAPIRISGVGLVNSLAGTGGPADPSPYRDQLVDEMRRNDIKDAFAILEQDDNALVRVMGTIPAGAKRGDPIDLVIESPLDANAETLHGGWLLETRLRQQKILGGRVRQGGLMAMGMGAVLPRSAFESGDDPRLATQGFVLGGGTVQESRQMGFVIRPEYQHVKVAAQIAAAINRRFFFFDGTTRRGVAKAVEDDYVEVEVHPRYEDSLGRYVSVLRSIVIDTSVSEQQTRLRTLASELADPATAAEAALQLEAIGESAIPTLIAGAKNANPELVFYAAESLAYLDRHESIEPLVRVIQTDPAFRYPAFKALEGAEHPGVVDSLKQLFDQESIETRYGAFNVMRQRRESGGMMSSKKIGKTCMFYRVASAAAPAIAISTRETPEVVVFGDCGSLRIDGAILGPLGLIVKPNPANPQQLRVSRFQVGEPDRRQIADATVAGLLEGIAAVGGDYADMVSVLRTAKSDGAIAEQLAIDPLPKPLRTYYRNEGSEESEGE